ncbi:glycosyltransferase family 4 protein [Patescibacteria group bacterium]
MSKRKNKKILLILRHFYPFTRVSGVTSFTRELLEELHSHNIDISVLCLKRKGEKDKYIYKGIKIYKYNQLNFLNFKKYISQVDPTHMVFLSSISSGISTLLWWGLWAKFAKQIPTLFYQTTNFLILRRNPILRKFFNRFCKIFVTSNSIKEDLAKVLDIDSTILYPGVNLDKMKNFRKERKYLKSIGFFGHVSYRKGTDVFIKQIDKFPCLKFYLIAGKSKAKEDEVLIDKIRKIKASNLMYKGYIDNPLEEMSKCDLLVLPFRTGASVLGTAQSAIEAMAIGIPVIGTKNSALESLVENGKNGFLVDSSEEITQKIKLLQKNEDLYNKLSEYSIKTIESKFNITKIADNIVKNLK